MIENAEKFFLPVYIFSLLILITNLSIKYVYTIALTFYSSAKLVSEEKSKDINKHILLLE